jgi:predicted 3-demethylubiquinone-9 3-methyltransferase (glyoxalase superfamily)
MLNGLDPEKSQRVIKAMMQMVKIDIETLKRAYPGR